MPVGAFVSGGVDSGAIAAAMARTSSEPFKMFTAGFPGSPRDETAAAKSVADHLGCEHIVLPMQPQTAADVLPAVQASFDEPTAANSAIPLWYLSRAAAEHVKVVLCGEGGDELFLGYNRQRWAKRMAQWRARRSGCGRDRASAPASGPQVELRPPARRPIPRRRGARRRLRALLRCRFDQHAGAALAHISSPNSFVARSSAAASRLAPRPIFPPRRAAAAVRP